MNISFTRNHNLLDKMIGNTEKLSTFAYCNKNIHIKYKKWKYLNCTTYSHSIL